MIENAKKFKEALKNGVVVKDDIGRKILIKNQPPSFKLALSKFFSSEANLMEFQFLIALGCCYEIDGKKITLPKNKQEFDMLIDDIIGEEGIESIIRWRNENTANISDNDIKNAEVEAIKK